MDSFRTANQPTWLEQWGWSSQCRTPVAAYVHIPFCHHRCGYCNFSLLANRSDLWVTFLDCLETELAALETPRIVETIFIGGGTPSILPNELLRRLLQSLHRWLPIADGGEFSIEANPIDIDEVFCQTLTEFGVDRISIGGQSFQPDKLRILERDHSAEQLIQAIRCGQRYMDSVSLDLIFAAPGESLAAWQSDVQTAIDLGLHHISTYGLTFEKGAKFWGRRERHEIESVPEEVELSMYESTIDMLTRAGMHHYEISNFSMPGAECRHNLHYWRGDAWWAFGPSAARYVGGVRSVNHRGTLQYMKRIEQGQCPTEEIERLSHEQQLREKFVFGMRQLDGVDWRWLREECDPKLASELEAIIERHLQQGWLQRQGTRIQLTRAGLVLSDSLWGEYL